MYQWLHIFHDTIPKVSEWNFGVLSHHNNQTRKELHIFAAGLYTSTHCRKFHVVIEHF
jgi:hypothetical protein